MTSTQTQTCTLEQSPFGHAPDGTPITLYTLRNSRGITVEILNLGGVILGIHTPDRLGNVQNIVLRHPDLGPYLDRKRSNYFGAFIGRYGNRIQGGQFTLDGQRYSLSTNEGNNTLHGGQEGFDLQVHRASFTVQPHQVQLKLQRTSPHLEQGFPGNLQVQVTYTLTDLSELVIDYRAITDAPTHVNLTNHSYFNLTGNPAQTILDHELTVYADHFTPTDSQLIPTGEVREVAGTPFDFRTPQKVGSRIQQPDPKLHLAGGYDHNFVLRNQGYRHAATLHDPASGRVLETFTTEPGIQVYSGNFLTQPKHGAICLETQHFPDTPNRPEFPSTVLRPGEVYQSRTTYGFKCRPLSF